MPTTDPRKEPGDFGVPSLAPLYVQGMNVSEVAHAGQTDLLSQRVDHNERFWATPARPINQNIDDLLIIKFPAKKLLNYLSFERSAFPHQCSVYYLTNEPEYLTGAQREVRHYKPLIQANGRAVDVSYRGSVPYVVNRAEVRQAQLHPHHFGAGHWLFEEFELQPIETEAIAIRLNRNLGSGQRGPVDPSDNPVDYSLAIRNLDLGYRIRSKEDIPRTNRDPQVVTEYESYTQVVDLAGSMVELKLRENRAEDLLQGKIWRSEPQPVSYAVVNLYVDARDDNGNPQVIDRFYIDPLTSGPHLNLYYSNEVPEGVEFAASNTPLSYPLSLAAGPGTIKTDVQGVRFPDSVAYIDISNKRIQWEPSKPFWIGIDFQPLWKYGSEETHVIFDAEVFRMEYRNGKFAIVSGNSRVELDADYYDTEDVDTEEPEDPTIIEHTGNSEEYEVSDTLSFVCGYNGSEIFFYSRKTGLVLADIDIPQTQNSIIRFGAPIGDVDLDYIPTGNFRLRSFVLKQEPLEWTDAPGGEDITIALAPSDVPEEQPIGIDQIPEVAIGSTQTQHLIIPHQVGAYLDDPIEFNRTPAYAHLDDGSTHNALIRMIPEFITPGGESSMNPFGFVGGPGNVYDQIKWTPITRDYKVRQGELQFLPTKARFFKFEFTNLTPQPYDVYSPVRRKVKLYTSDVTKASSVIRTPSGSETSSSPLTINQDISSVFIYSDSIRYATRQATGIDVSPIEAIYAKSAREKDRLDRMGSMYTYQPWHPSSQTPRIQDSRRHSYETVEVSHFQRIAYFVGLSQLLMYRVDYHVDDDTPEYIETFGDDTFLDSLSLHERLVPGHDNFISNPSFEAENIFDQWTEFSEGMTASPAVIRRMESGEFGSAAYGTYFAHIQSNDATDSLGRVGIYQDITPDVAPTLFPSGTSHNVTLSLFARGSGMATTLTVSIKSYGATDNLLNTDVKNYELSEADTYWNAYRVHGSIPTDAAKVRVEIKTISNPTYGEGGTQQYRADLDIDAVQLELGESASPYIDGDSEGAIWLGDPEVSPSRYLDKIEQPWILKEDRIETPAELIGPVTLESSVFRSRRKVRGVQFATTQSAPKQLLSDSFLDDEKNTFWAPVGDVLKLEHHDLNGSALQDVVRIQREPGANVWGDLELTFPTWGDVGNNTRIYESMEGDEDAASTGGIRYQGYIYTSPGARLYAAARVYTDQILNSPLTLQVIDRNNSVLAERTVIPRAKGVTEWWVPYTVGETGESEDRTWGGIEDMDEDPGLPTYGDLELYSWRDLVSQQYQENREVSVQIIQQGSSKDVFYVDNISLFEDSIKWEFSNDGGRNWYPAYGIRNNPDGVLIFPPVANPSQDSETELKWRVTGYRPNVYVGNLVIRPWYAGMTYGIQPREAGVTQGPNQTPTDQFGEIENDPFFKNYHGSIPQDWYFSFRQLMLHDREYAPIEVRYQQTLFGNLYAGRIDPNDTGSGIGLQDQYTSAYTLLYGNPASNDTYVIYYDPTNEY